MEHTLRKIPKDRQIVITIDLGTYVGQWSPADEMFVYASPLIDLYDGKWNMLYFENEYVRESEIKNWREL